MQGIEHHNFSEEIRAQKGDFLRGTHCKPIGHQAIDSKYKAIA